MFIGSIFPPVSVLQILNPATDIKEAYANGRDTEQQFIQNLALFLCTFLKEHGTLIEKKGMNDQLMSALHYLVLISEVDDVEIFKICLEYWNALATELYRETPLSPFADPLMCLSKRNASAFPRKVMYQQVLTKVSDQPVASNSKTLVLMS
jgi:exportin-1